MHPILRKTTLLLQPLRAFSTLNLIDVATLKLQGEHMQFNFKGLERQLLVRD